MHVCNLGIANAQSRLLSLSSNLIANQLGLWRCHNTLVINLLGSL